MVTPTAGLTSREVAAAPSASAIMGGAVASAASGDAVATGGATTARTTVSGLAAGTTYAVFAVFSGSLSVQATQASTQGGWRDTLHAMTRHCAWEEYLV